MGSWRRAAGSKARTAMFGLSMCGVRLAAMLAAQVGHEAVVGALVGAGAAVDQAMYGGWTALTLAAHTGHEAVVRMLKEAKH